MMHGQKNIKLLFPVLRITSATPILLKTEIGWQTCGKNYDVKFDKF